jgi:hypothetical protein
MPDPDNPAEVKLIVEQLNGVILEEKPMYVSYKKVPKRQLTPRFNLPKKLICLNLLRNNVRSKILLQEELQVLAKKTSIKNLIRTRLDEKLELDPGKPAGYYAEATSPRKKLLGVMNPPSSSSQATRRAFDNLSLELQKTTEDDNFTKELEEFLKIMDNNDIDEEDFYKYFEFEHEECTEHVRYSIHYLCNVDNIPSSDS